MADLGIAQARGLDGSRHLPVGLIIRSALFVMPFFLHWISFHPFFDRSVLPDSDSLHGGDIVNQIGFTALFAAMVAWALFNEPGRLKVLFRPTLVIMLVWFVMTGFVSWEPLLSFRRLIFAIIIIITASITLLLPKNLRQFCDLISIVALAVLALCYLGVLFAPSLSIHQLTDVLEPEHAGSWRGTFKHKNEAGGVMVMFVCIGVFVARARNFLVGGLICGLSLIFLIFSFSKTSILLLPFTFLMSFLLLRLRTLRWRMALVVGTLGLLSLLSIGSIYHESIRALVEQAGVDATFTARTDIWQFGIEYLMRRPIAGYGFLSFWGTDEVVLGLSESTTWATAATDAHNSYINLALSTGFPGLLLVIAWLVVLPLVDFHRAPVDGPEGHMARLFLRLWLFGVFGSCFESIFFKSGGEPWFGVLIAVLGLRMLSSSRLAR